jgi:hypothetical protein
MTLPETLLYLFPLSWAAGWSCLSAATGEAAVRVRGGPGQVRVGVGRCRSRDVSTKKHSSADHYFRDHLVVPRRHVNLFPRYEAVVRLPTENSAPGIRMLHRGYSDSVVLLDIIAREAAGVATADTHPRPLPAGVSGPQVAAYRYLSDGDLIRLNRALLLGLAV